MQTVITVPEPVAHRARAPSRRCWPSTETQALPTERTMKPNPHSLARTGGRPSSSRAASRQQQLIERRIGQKADVFAALPPEKPAAPARGPARLGRLGATRPGSSTARPTGFSIK
jgi:hypothetical protein